MKVKLAVMTMAVAAVAAFLAGCGSETVATPSLATKVHSAATWTAAEAPLPANADHTFAGLSSVACPSATACTAVGSYTGSAGEQGLLLSKSGTTWTASQAPLPAGAPADPHTTLGPVKCASATACVAIGRYYLPSGDQEGLLLTGAGSSWTAVVAPLPTGAASPPAFILYGVACASTSCVVTGAYTDQSGNTQGLLLTGFGSSWTAFKMPLPPDAAANPFADAGAVTCPSASQCVAAGGYTDASGQPQGLLLTGSGTSWTEIKPPAPVNANTATPWVSISSVACPSPSVCTAVGSYQDQSGTGEGLLLIGSGTSWAARQAPIPANALPKRYNSLSAVTCLPTLLCTAIGIYGDSNTTPGQDGFLLTGSGSSWVPTETPLSGNVNLDSQSRLDSVACTSAGTCVATGSYHDVPDNTRALLVSGAASSWSATEPPFLGNTAGSPHGYGVQAVTCIRKTTTCVAVGSYPDQAGNAQGLLLTGSP